MSLKSFFGSSRYLHRLSRYKDSKLEFGTVNGSMTYIFFLEMRPSRNLVWNLG